MRHCGTSIPIENHDQDGAERAASANGDGPGPHEVKSPAFEEQLLSPQMRSCVRDVISKLANDTSV